MKNLLAFVAVFLTALTVLLWVKDSRKRMTIEEITLTGEKIARVGFLPAANEPQVQYFDTSSEDLDVTEDETPPTNPGSTPNHWSSGSVPNHWSSSSVPNHWSSSSVPNHWSSGSVPNHWSSSSVPNQWSSSSVPNQWSSGSVPNQWSSSSTPNHWSSGNQPNTPSQAAPQSGSGNEEWLLSGRYALPSPKVDLERNSF